MTTDPARLAELRAFDATKAGVKGLVDAGFTSVPGFFVHPDPAEQPVQNHELHRPASPISIPVVDLAPARSHGPGRRHVAAAVARAAETLGFFYVLNHGVARQVLDEMLERVRAFNEEGAEARREYYSRDPSRKVRYYSNFDLFQAPAANWRDSLFFWMAPEPPRPEELPIACREVTFKYSNHVGQLGKLLFELLSESLGLPSNYLEEMECAKGHALVANYYPPCPEPHLTFGTSKHSDPDFLTILVQDQVGGLQVLYQHQWIDVPPVAGALLVNIGDLLQLMTNDKFKSVEHRVLANKSGPRVSVACFFTMHLYQSSLLYGPIKELLCDENPPLYKDILLKDFVSHYDSKGLDGRSALSYFRL